jgi:hypothetical protein
MAVRARKVTYWVTLHRGFAGLSVVPSRCLVFDLIGVRKE